MSVQTAINAFARRAARVFEKSATNFVILVDKNSYVTSATGVYTPVLVEARIYHSEYAANCALAQHRGYLAKHEVEIVPLYMSVSRPLQKEQVAEAIYQALALFPVPEKIRLEFAPLSKLQEIARSATNALFKEKAK